MYLRYNMPPDVTQAEMPSIDMRRTAINEHCPAYLKKPRCSLKRFREYNGMCNNLDQPHWGATLTPFRRLIPAAYGDGKYLAQFGAFRIMTSYDRTYLS